jgi:hypothetical protein
VLDRVNDIAGSGFAFGANHGCAFGDAAQSFAEIACTAYEWNFEGVLINVMSFVGGSQDFGFVDVIHAKLFEDLRLGKVSDAAFRHDRDGNCGHDLANFLWSSHARDSAFGANLRGDTLERHHCDGSGLLGNDRLLGGRHVHDDAALEHFGEAGFQAKAGRISVVLGHKHLFSNREESAQERAVVLSERRRPLVVFYL